MLKIQPAKSFDDTLAVLLKKFPIEIMISNLELQTDYIHCEQLKKKPYIVLPRNEFQFEEKEPFKIIYDPKHKDSPINYPDNYYCDNITDLEMILSFVKKNKKIY